MVWTVRFHPLTQSDLSRLDKPGRESVLKAIRKKLFAEPESYGEPLRRELFGYRKLKVGEHRVIYKVERQIVTVLVLKVGLRRDGEVYADMIRRLKSLR